jgi:glycosyltransferase involved in cell wall biosynthesis
MCAKVPRLNLHLYPSVITHESRMLRITEALAGTGLFSRILLVGRWVPGLPEHEPIDAIREIVRVRTAARRFSCFGVLGKALDRIEWSARCVLRFRKHPVASVSAHSLTALPAAALLKALGRCKLVYDTHELETESSGARGLRKLFAKFVERALFRQVDGAVVVSPSIAAWYARAYDADQIAIVRNIPRRHNSVPAGSLLRERFAIPVDALVFLYQGVLAPSRGTRLLLRVFSQLTDRHHIVFLGLGPDTDRVLAYAIRHRNIHYHPAVSPAELPALTGGADVGLCLIENSSLSLYYSLPNKLFEYLVCGVPVIVSNFPDMAAVIDETGAGWKVEDSDSALLACLASLTPDQVRAKAAAARSVHETLSWESEEPRLFALYERLFELRAGTLTESRHAS